MEKLDEGFFDQYTDDLKFYGLTDTKKEDGV